MVELKEIFEALERREEITRLVRYDPETSKLSLAGITVAPMHDYFLPAVFAALEKQIGPVARTLIIRYARKVGSRDGEILRKTFFQDRPPTIEEVERLTRSFLGMWCQVGWGKIVKFQIGKDHAYLVRSTSYEGEGYLKLGGGPAKTPRCWIALGYVIGVFEGLLDRSVEGEEVECLGKGDQTCTFKLKW
ncbi:MAG: hypothetical protein DRO52_02310 [Candidatus Hecatellales archaeon]|nr:MAG: hypothetical protein DRO52_02310 [Candidatus Hecatellales archaeon]